MHMLKRHTLIATVGAVGGDLQFESENGDELARISIPADALPESIRLGVFEQPTDDPQLSSVFRLEPAGHALD